MHTRTNVPDEIDEETDPGCCPNCGSENVDWPKTNNPADHKEGVAYRTVCKDCGCKYNEVYTLSFLGTEVLHVPRKRKT